MSCHQPTLLKQPCCTSAPKVHSDYVPKGHEITLDDITIYETCNPKESKRVLICAYDIFGFHRNTKEVCDLLAEQGDFLIVLPDFYRGDYWNEDRLIQIYYSWINYKGCWEDTTHKDILNVIEHYKKNGATIFGMFGFCWGGKMSVFAGTQIPDIKCIGLVHPSGVKIYEANHLNCPVILLPSSSEIDLIPFKNRIVDRMGEDQCEHHRFENMMHGFCAARGDFQNPEVREAVTKVIEYLNRFFNAHLPKVIQEV